MQQEDLLLAVVVLMLAAAISVPFFRWLGLGSVIGFLTAGVVVGPWGLKITTEVETIRHFSEFGVVFLLFLIGLELRLSKLWGIRRVVFGLGGSQIMVTGGLIAVYAWAFGVPWNVALVVGFGLSMSSTAFGLQILTEKGEMGTRHGRASFGILLMQDLAVVPMLAIVPFMGEMTRGQGDPYWVAVLKAVVVIICVVAFGRYVLPRIFRAMATSGNTGSFTGVAIMTVLGAAWVMEQVNLSMALGAFLVGLLLSDSEYRHQIEAVIQPLREFLLGLFFMAVGMSIDFGLITESGFVVFGTALSVLVFKALALYVLCRLAGYTKISSFRVSLLLPQVGEFGFVLFGVAIAHSVIDEHLFKHLLLLIAMTMALTPFLDVISTRIANRLDGTKGLDMEDGLHGESEHHVLIAGFGRVGGTIAMMLRNSDVPYLALDINAKVVENGRARGFHAFYGDASKASVLQAAGAGYAKLVIITIDNQEAAERAVSAIRYLYPGLPIQARTFDLAHSEKLHSLGANFTVPEHVEISLQLGREALLHLGRTESYVTDLVDDIRQNDYAVLRNTAYAKSRQSV